MAPYQIRVVEEKADLDDRLAKLRTFQSTDTFKGLDGDEQWRLRRQSYLMQLYSDVLAERIHAFPQ